MAAGAHLALGGCSTQDPVLGPGVCGLHLEGAATHGHGLSTTQVSVGDVHQERAGLWRAVPDLVLAVLQVCDAGLALHQAIC